MNVPFVTPKGAKGPRDPIFPHVRGIVCYNTGLRFSVQPLKKGKE